MEILSILESSSAILAATLANTPRWFATTILILASKSLAISWLHVRSNQLLILFRFLTINGQSCIWINRPWFFLISPTIWSPGIGWQHFANCTTMPSVPRIEMASLVLLCQDTASPGFARRFATTAGKCFPSPMSVSNSFFDLAPLSRASFCHWAAFKVSGLTLNDNNAWFSKRFPNSADSSDCIVFRKWRIWDRALPVNT